MLGVLGSQYSIEYEIWPLVIRNVKHSGKSGNLVELLTKQFKYTVI